MLQRRIEQFLRRSGMKPARFGRNVVRDPRLVFDLRRGRELRPATEQRIRDYLDEQEALLRAADAEGRAEAA
jgi:2,4-dienoyl-CoA reductase-like NADH-dependent reductase (Old Yellow Enzyme family)